ncbi:MAG: acyl-CoA dehydrogenase family protein [Candidatus Aenigmarchaeota archaeon]|nr:acyl-CoA dehydrogenase family protein [Candidatus Aenigmarchaeota archaeon]
MDFQFTPTESALRREVAAFVRHEWPQRYDPTSLWVASYDVGDAEVQEYVREFTRKVAKKGWWTMHWPKEYGGSDAPLSTQIAYREAMARAGAPVAVPGYEAEILMRHGSPQQKRHFLPLIASGELLRWSQGYSEPDAGSDLASIQTRAVRDGDDFIITGQKTWNSDGLWADWGHYMARTDPNVPKHRGISYFIIDMHSPGISIRPIYDGLGRQRWSEVTLDNVRVPKEHLIGDENRGFYTAMETLSIERAQIEVPARRLCFLEGFIDYAISRNTPLIQDPVVRNRLADLRTRIEASRMLCYRVAWMQNKGLPTVSESSMVKVMNDELGADVYRTIASLLGDTAMFLPRSSPLSRVNGFAGVNAWLAPALRLAGGSDEVQRNIIAERDLGLPR